MKKLTFLACAAMLTSALVFTGCKNENEPAKKAPTITTDIAISLPGQVGTNAKRMPGITVQDGNTTSGGVHDDFATNGMKNIVLIPFAEKAKVSIDNNTNTKRYGADINLPNFDGSQAMSKSPNGRTKVYTDQQVPMGTSAFLFYAESNAANSNLYRSGALYATLTGDPASYKFALQSTCTDVTNLEADAATFEAYLNLVANAVDTLYGGAAWKNITAAQNQGYYDMFQAYSSLNALSTFGVERMMTDLYQSLKVNMDSLSKAIRKAIINPTYASLVNDKVVLVSGLQNYPQKYNVPVGSVSVAYASASGEFGSNAAHAYGDLAPASVSSYVYPASLWYMANTQIKTSNSSKADAYTSAESWKAILAQYENNEATVNTRTKSIALIDTIQYAVARLDVSVKTAAGTTLQDNNPVATSRTVNIPTGGYPLKAVLVGNQRNAGFDFTPLSSSAVYTIYDTIMTATIAANPSATVYSAANSTLVMETAADDGNHGSDVFVALEFVNTGADFYGINQQLIPAGGRFYMVGQLEAASATATDNKVFKQDFKTIARFSIANLTKAYNTIPDLKAPQLEIGMSVDLSWQDGTTFDITLQ